MFDKTELRQLQDDVGEWSEQNFGVSPLHGGDGSPPEHALIGAGEELGELTRSVLKREQGIDDDEKYAERDDVGPDAERDAVGDIVIYLLDCLHRAEDDIYVADGLADIEEHRPDDLFEHVDDAVTCIRMLYSYYGEITGLRLYLISDDEWGDPDEYEWKSESDDLNRVALKTAEVVALLRRFCEIRGYNFEQCVREAWEEVSGREWDATVSEADE